MDNTNIIKSNKLIALFMGGITSEMNINFVRGYQNIWLPIHGICDWSTIDLGKGKILQYHSSWDWLIPVIDKISSLDEYPEFRNKSGCVFDDKICIDTKSISNTYDQVVVFVNWLKDFKLKHT